MSDEMPNEIFIQYRDRTKEQEHEFRGNNFRVSDTDTRYIKAHDNLTGDAGIALEVLYGATLYDNLKTADKDNLKQQYRSIKQALSDKDARIRELETQFKIRKRLVTKLQSNCGKYKDKIRELEGALYSSQTLVIELQSKVYGNGGE